MKQKRTLDESQVPKKGFFARLKYRLEQMKAKHIEEEKAEEEVDFDEKAFDMIGPNAPRDVTER